MKLKGKISLVTGAGRRGGRAIALELGHRGVNVAVHYHTSRRGAFAVVRRLRKMGVKAEAFRADLSKLRQVTQLARRVQRQLGPIDVLARSPSGTGKRRSTPISRGRFFSPANWGCG